MIKMDEDKLVALPTADEMLDSKYGSTGTAAREEFNAKAIAWYYGTILHERRRELKFFGVNNLTT